MIIQIYFTCMFHDSTEARALLSTNLLNAGILAFIIFSGIPGRP